MKSLGHCSQQKRVSSLPSRERGLKFGLLQEVVCLFIPSLPSRERGLKWQRKDRKCDRMVVAPLAGAWIEIIASESCKEILQSLPSRERGLKSYGNNNYPVALMSLPSRERGLKSYARTPTGQGVESLPSRERGLKSRRNTLYFIMARSRSPRGSVD